MLALDKGHFTMLRIMAESQAHRFPTTSITLLEWLQAGQEVERRRSLEHFCQFYQLPIYGWLRMLGQTPQDAQDHTQIFLMEKVWQEKLAGFDREHGARFRSWLMTCLKNQVIKDHKAKQTLKRGGGKVILRLDTEALEREVLNAQTTHLEPGPTFDLLLAREIWRAVRSILTGSQKPQKVALMRDLLPAVLMEKWPPPPFPSQQDIADKHGTTLVKLRGYFHHTLKSKTRRVFNEEARACSPGITSEDLDYLWHMLRRHGEAAD